MVAPQISGVSQRRPVSSAARPVPRGALGEHRDCLTFVHGAQRELPQADAVQRILIHGYPQEIDPDTDYLSESMPLHLFRRRTMVRQRRFAHWPFLHWRGRSGGGLEQIPQHVVLGPRGTVEESLHRLAAIAV